jgi:hypothetical protein
MTLYEFFASFIAAAGVMMLGIVFGYSVGQVEWRKQYEEATEHLNRCEAREMFRLHGIDQ